MALSAAIYNLIRSDANVVTTVGTKVYPDIVPHDVRLPAISYTVNNITVTETKDSTTGWDNADITVMIYAINRTDAETLAGYIRTAFAHNTGTYGSETILSTGHEGESWDFVLDETNPENSKVGKGVCLQSINFRVVAK